MDVLHGLARLLHGQQGFPVDVGRLDGVDLLLQRADLRYRLVETVLMRLLPFQGSLGGCRDRGVSTSR